MKLKLGLPRIGFRIIPKNSLEEPRKFAEILVWYVGKKVKIIGKVVENLKNFLVDGLLYKRGRFAKLFLHGGMVFIVAGVLVSAPMLASNFPLLGSVSGRVQLAEASSSVLSLDTGEVTTSVSDKPRDSVIEHRVATGENLSQIASIYKVSIDSIKWLNSDVTNFDDLSVGQILKIPPVTGIVHKVESGDDIYALAKKYRSNAQAIVDFPFNQFANDETFDLVVGQDLVIPDGVAPVAPPPVAAPQFEQYGVYGTPVAGGNGMFMWPTQGIITQYFTWYHSGLDIANPSNPPVVAAASGRVVIAEYLDWGYGIHAVIDHGNGYQTLYGHMIEMYVSTEPGKNEVTAGQVIGKMGSTGRSTGTHLHFEVRYNGVFQDPLQFLK
jgi:murein DD-endopeptidase MepM/ murein hydrolase activator NlpD